jgi:hypothetical protein
MGAGLWRILFDTDESLIMVDVPWVADRLLWASTLQADGCDLSAPLQF